MATTPTKHLNPSQKFIERMVMIVAVLGTAMVYLDQTALNVALPAIQLSLGAGIGDLQWIIDIYILIMAILLFVGGMLGDRFGRVR
ncbi:MAG: MFS transporter, partial [Chloroflexota bacterium]